ncbi:hypothetical protein [Facklamia miroungae]|uniref:Uncharacterized protein n=1 Tax=Facklamia miroungae TaxID=120956 RepID=A0A1G7UI13_9LACT|nr:hypothetical protein [Facklamia miroungae]NKZ30096.1 hypothetical protein [Facklamia miroungae]SDG47144.1 hypothetical protein SAMN05421791_11025 [Facklamia miroungae]
MRKLWFLRRKKCRRNSQIITTKIGKPVFFLFKEELIEPLFDSLLFASQLLSLIVSSTQESELLSENPAVVDIIKNEQVAA